MDGRALVAGEQRVERVLVRFRTLRDAWGTAAALTTRACFALARGDLESLRGNAEDARAHFAELGDLWGRLKTTDVLGRLAEINGDYDRAAQLHRESLRIAQALETWPEMSTKLSGLGRIALLTQRYDEADDLHTRALRLAVEQGNQPAEQFAALGLALSARRQGRLDAAEEWLRPWLAWNRRRGDGPGLALVLAELGFIAEQRGDAGRALAYHRDGLAAAATTKDPARSRWPSRAWRVRTRWPGPRSGRSVCSARRRRPGNGPGPAPPCGAGRRGAHRRPSARHDRRGRVRPRVHRRRPAGPREPGRGGVDAPGDAMSRSRPAAGVSVGGGC
ncbi:tetratricopeptide repeat protein [Streptomyces sp. MS1.AVA.1]|uniref:Tetratricopeptide repeat protein n=1 Tax=Streptomyces machairae TaxID=3134109 RepID=A0ABU8UJM7_9ACTN